MRVEDLGFQTRNAAPGAPGPPLWMCSNVEVSTFADAPDQRRMAGWLALALPETVENESESSASLSIANRQSSKRESWRSTPDPRT